MKIHIINNARSFIVSYWNDNSEWEDACPYSNIDAAMEAAANEIDVRQQALGAVILDAETGEVYVTCHWDDSIIPEEAYGDVDWDNGCLIDDIDESNYDPYAGCDMYEVEPFDFGGEF